MRGEEVTSIYGRETTVGSLRRALSSLCDDAALTLAVTDGAEYGLWCTGADIRVDGDAPAADIQLMVGEVLPHEGDPLETRNPFAEAWDAVDESAGGCPLAAIASMLQEKMCGGGCHCWAHTEWGCGVSEEVRVRA